MNPRTRNLFLETATLVLLMSGSVARPASAAGTAPASPPPAGDPEWKVTGEIRLRGEMRSNPDFLVATPDRGDILPLRTRVTASGRLPDSPVCARLTVEDARSIGEPAYTLPTLKHSPAFYEANLRFGEARSGRATLTAGRMPLSYGSGLLIANPPWSPTGRTFDAVAARYVFPKRRGWFEAFTAEPRICRTPLRYYTVPSQGAGKPAVASKAGPDERISGAYLTWRITDLDALDLYHFRLTDDSPAAAYSESRVAGARRTNATGVRYAGSRGKHWSGDVEFVSENGCVSADRLSARMFSSNLRYDFKKWKTKPVLRLEHLEATGDGTPGDGRVGTFDKMFGLAHRPLGTMDTTGLRNIVDDAVYLSWKLPRDLSAELSRHALRLSSATDAWYGSNGACPAGRRDLTGKAGKDVGTEWDLVLSKKASRNLTVDLGLSAFRAGSFVERRVAGGGGNSTWSYLSLGAKF